MYCIIIYLDFKKLVKMMELLFLALAFFLLGSLILPWVNLFRINNLEEEIYSLKKMLREQSYSSHQQPENADDLPSEKNITQDFSDNEITNIKEQTPLIELITENNSSLSEAVQEKNYIGFERQFGMRLPVWGGGIALALAGFFLVKYSIEIGLLTPFVRVILGIIFGISLLYVGDKIRNKENFANGTRIAQALSGAGIADLYVSIFAATRLYEFLPPFIGFTFMAGITALAVIISLRHGMPIAVLGLIGGFLTPAMVESQNPQAPLLFGYLYFILAGFMFVIRKQSWWILSIPTVIVSFSYVLIWLFGSHFVPSDSLYLGLFLLASSATIVLNSQKHYAHENTSFSDWKKIPKILDYLSLSSATILMGVIAVQSGLSIMEWGLFGLLALGVVALAFFNQKLYGLMPLISMAVNAVMFMIWDDYNPSIFALTISIFSVIYIASGYFSQSHSENPFIWSIVVALTSIGYYLISYCHLHQNPIADYIPLFWGFFAFILSGLGIFALKKIIQDFSDTHFQKQHLLAVYSVISTAFLSIGLTIELRYEFLSIALALQISFMAWINLKINIKALRYIIAILGIIFCFLLIPQILLVIQLTIYSLLESQLYLQESIPFIKSPLLQLGLPAISFAYTSYFLRLQNDNRLVRLFEVGSVMLVGTMGYYLTRHIFHTNLDILFVKAGFFERGVITNILFVYGLTCLWIGKYYTRQTISVSGLVLVGVAIFRTIYFDYLLYNPLVEYQKVGHLPLINALIITYGLPILWILRTIKELDYLNKQNLQKYGYGLMMLFAFTWLSLNVRQLFHGEYLNSSVVYNSEIYIYSAVWLVFGLGLLYYGTLKNNKMIRSASLGIMILTVGKVFLYDASELEGLLRIISFFGLGISLIGISWFYSKYVFQNEK